MKQFKIFQLKATAETRNFRFASLEELDEFGLRDQITLDNYNLVFEGETETGEAISVLERLFRQFNLNHPEGFRGHSLSVSDIVEMDGKYYYCDSFGWEEISLQQQQNCNE